MMVKIALFVVTMVKVARLGSGAPYAGSGRIKTVLGQIHLVTCYSSGGHRFYLKFNFKILKFYLK
jgi:hypothetical protein